MNKKIVHYKGKPIILGNRALIDPIDHPDSVRVSNECTAYTSPIVSYDPISGVLETRNTVYKPQLLL